MNAARSLLDLADDGLPCGSASDLLRRMLDAAVRSASPSLCLPPHLPPPPPGRTVVIGAGKAAAAMAQAVERNWAGDLSGLVITRHGHGVPCQRIEVVEAGHPVPDEAGLAATARLVDLLQGLTRDDLVLCLLSGGGSALLCAPMDGMTLADDMAVARALLRSGASIAEMNCVRKHLSAVKGGRLAALAEPATLVTIAISDVPGDEPSVIASGPTVADPTTREDALAILHRYGIDVSAAVRRVLEEGAETPKRDGLPRADYRLIATPQAALEAAARVAEDAGYRALILGDSIEGEAREVAIVHAGIARQVRRHAQPASAPCVLLSGGETTVTVRGGGRGGRNAEFLLSLAIALDGEPNVTALAADTDGIDGTEDNAGAIVTPAILERARAEGMDARDFLARNDGYGFFDRLGVLVRTGPTMTKSSIHRIAVIPGDGIGKEVVPEGLRVLSAVTDRFGCRFECDHFDFASCDHFLEHGAMMPPNWKELIGGHDAIFFGAVGWPDSVPDHVSLWGSLIQFRREFDQYVNLRPVKLMPGVPSPLAGRAPGEIDFYVVRENTEGEYSSIGGRIFPDTDREIVMQETVMTRVGVDRILRFAFDLAQRRDKKHLTSATKSNGIAITMPFWDERVEAMAPSYPAVRWDKYHIDILTAHFVQHPDWFDVVVASNLFGDILSDLGPACTGTIGIAPAGNINPERRFPSLFEPVHGSAPDIAGMGIANPIGQIWSASLMLDHLGETEAAAAVLRAIEEVLAKPEYRTRDLGGTASTVDCGKAVADALASA